MSFSQTKNLNRTGIFMIWMMGNVVVDGIAAANQNAIPYRTILLTFLFFSLCALIAMKRKKFDWVGINLLVLAAGFLYIIGMNIYTPLHIPYWALIYPIIFISIYYINEKWEPEGLNKFFLYLGGYTLAIGGVVFYMVQTYP